MLLSLNCLNGEGALDVDLCDFFDGNGKAIQNITVLDVLKFVSKKKGWAPWPYLNLFDYSDSASWIRAEEDHASPAVFASGSGDKNDAGGGPDVVPRDTVIVERGNSAGEANLCLDELYILVNNSLRSELKLDTEFFFQGRGTQDGGWDVRKLNESEQASIVFVREVCECGEGDPVPHALLSRQGRDAPRVPEDFPSPRGSLLFSLTDFLRCAVLNNLVVLGAAILDYASAAAVSTENCVGIVTTWNPEGRDDPSLVLRLLQEYGDTVLAPDMLFRCADESAGLFSICGGALLQGKERKFSGWSTVLRAACRRASTHLASKGCSYRVRHYKERAVGWRPIEALYAYQKICAVLARQTRRAEEGGRFDKREFWERVRSATVSAFSQHPDKPLRDSAGVQVWHGYRSDEDDLRTTFSFFATQHARAFQNADDDEHEREMVSLWKKAVVTLREDRGLSTGMVESLTVDIRVNIWGSQTVSKHLHSS